MKYVLDTNIVIAALNRTERVRQRLGSGATLVTNDGGLLDGSIAELRLENWVNEVQ